MVLAPEHNLVGHITTPAQAAFVATYKAQVSGKSDLDRTELAKDKQGVFTAHTPQYRQRRKNPHLDRRLCSAKSGTGAIMAVPGPDTRDFEFRHQVQSSPSSRLCGRRGQREWQGIWTPASRSIRQPGISLTAYRRPARKKKITACGIPKIRPQSITYTPPTGSSAASGIGVSRFHSLENRADGHVSRRLPESALPLWPQPLRITSRTPTASPLDSAKTG